VTRLGLRPKTSDVVVLDDVNEVNGSAFDAENDAVSAVDAGLEVELLGLDRLHANAGRRLPLDERDRGVVAGPLAIAAQGRIRLLPILRPNGLEKSLRLGHARFPCASGPEALHGVEVHGERGQECGQSLNFSKLEIAG
jgi:hypothetical protein